MKKLTSNKDNCLCTRIKVERSAQCEVHGDRRAWLPTEIGDRLVEMGHASFDANSGTYYVNHSTLKLISEAVR